LDCTAPQVIKGVGALGQGVGHEEFQLAGLVAPGGQAEQVVSFDVDVGPAQGGGEAGQEFNGGLAGGVAPAGEFG
jgi:hypothetical protein